MTDRPDADPEIVRLVSIALDMRERGIEPPLAEICATREDLLPAVEKALRVVDRMPAMREAAADFDPLEGVVLGERYRLERQIGAGSMGFVYRGLDRELGRKVAVKVLRSDLFGGSQAEARFLREAEALAAVHHPAIVAVYDRGTTDAGLMYLVMELVDGVPLDDLLRRGEALRDKLGAIERVIHTDWIADQLERNADLEPSYVRQCVAWSAALAEGLHCAHAAGIIHRDVKPSNIIIRRDGSPVVIDFGIAAIDAEQTIASGQGVVGTPAYMAPERLEDRPVTTSVDIYGLAATLYHALTLTPPYRGSSEDVLKRLARRDPSPVDSVRRDLPRDLLAILDTGMDREVSRRYPTIRDLHLDLQALLEHRPVAARPTNLLDRTWRRLRRSRDVRVVASVVATLGVLATLWWWNSAEAQRTGREWLETWSGVGPTLCIAPTSMRAIEADDARRVVLARLDRLVELSTTPIPSRVIRGAFRWDHGDRHGAAEDADAVAEWSGSKFTRALATAYAARDERLVDVPTGELPPPETAEDRYIAALHVFREKRSPNALSEALNLLDDAKTAALHYAAEFAMILEVDRIIRKRGAARIAAFDQLYLKALDIEHELGQKTATTRMIAGTALNDLGYEERSLEALEEAVALAPYDHGARINLAAALGNRRRGDEAREHLQEAVRLRPKSTNSHRVLALQLAELGYFDEALERARATPFEDSAAGERQRAELSGKIHLDEAMARLRGGDSAGAIACARSALDAFDSAGLTGTERPRHEVLRSRAIVDGRTEHVFAGLLIDLARDPSDWRLLEQIRRLMPSSFDSEQVAALNAYFAALVAHFSHSQLPTRPPTPDSTRSSQGSK